MDELAKVPAKDEPTDPGDLRGAVAKMHAIAEGMASASASSQLVMAGQMEAALSAVRTLSTKVDDVVVELRKEIGAVDQKADMTSGRLDDVQLSPVRNRAVTLPEILEPGASPSQAPAGVSMRAIANAVGADGADERAPGPEGRPPPLAQSMRAIARDVPAARKENRLLNAAILLLVAIVEVLHMLHR